MGEIHAPPSPAGEGWGTGGCSAFRNGRPRSDKRYLPVPKSTFGVFISSGGMSKLAISVADG